MPSSVDHHSLVHGGQSVMTFRTTDVFEKEAVMPACHHVLGVLCHTYCGGGVILENIVCVLSKLTVSAAKALINKGLPAFCRAFAAETVNFDTKNHNVFK